MDDPGTVWYPLQHDDEGDDGIPMDRPTLVTLLRMAADTSGQPLTQDERALLIGLAMPYEIGPEDGLVL